MTHEQKPESAEFRTREAQIDEIYDATAKAVCRGRSDYPPAIYRAYLGAHIARAEARGAAEREAQGFEEAKDEGANYVLTSLALLFGRDGFEIRDGSETWEGDVNATLEGILKAGGLVDDEGDLLDLATLKDRLSEQRRKDAEGADLLGYVTQTGEDGLRHPYAADAFMRGVLNRKMDKFNTPVYTRPANVAALEAEIRALKAQLGAMHHGTMRQVIHSPLSHFKPEDRS